MVEQSESNVNASPVENERDDEFLEKYLRPKRFGSKFWLHVVLVIAFLFLAYIVKTTVFDRVVDPQELVTAIEVFDTYSQWVIKEKVDTPEYQGVIVVPRISFRVRNVGKKSLEYVYFLGIFQLLNRATPLGEDFRTAFNTPFKSGEESEPIVLTCQFGFKAPSLESFNQNKKEWKDAQVKMFVRSSGTRLAPLKTIPISTRVEGMGIDVKIIAPPEDLKKSTE